MRFSRITPWIASLFIIPTASFGPHLAAIAQYGVGVRSVFSSQAQGLKGGSAPNITVWPGTGMNISFIPVNENILKVWLDDPSRITVDFDRPLCDAVTGSPTSGDSCSEPSAQVVHLRQVRGITFPNLPTASSTLLSVVTVDQRRQRRLYHFYVDTASGAPEYSALIVTPDEGIRDTSQLTIRGGRKVDIETVSVGLR